MPQSQQPAVKITPYGALNVTFHPNSLALDAGRTCRDHHGGAASAAAPAGRGAVSVFPRLHSEYVRMPDGVRLAVDVWLPPGTTAGARLPTVLEADRYWRVPAYTGGITNNKNYYTAK